MDDYVSLRDSVTVLDARSLTASDADGDRIARWQDQHRDGYVFTMNTNTGHSPALPSWYHENQISRDHAWRSRALKLGVRLQTLAQWRPDVMGPSVGAAEAWCFNPVACARSTEPWMDAVARWIDVGWSWELSGGLNREWWAGLPADRAIYALQMNDTKKLQITSVLTNISAAVDDLVANAIEWRDYLHVDGLLVDAKPWERAGQPIAVPGGVDGRLQPNGDRAGSWEMNISNVLIALGPLMPVVTLTRPSGLVLADIIKSPTAINACAGEVNLRPATEAT